jgi:hypothetical protein
MCPFFPETFSGSPCVQNKSKLSAAFQMPGSNPHVSFHSPHFKMGEKLRTWVQILPLTLICCVTWWSLVTLSVPCSFYL